MQGKVKWFNVKNNYGYVTDDQGNDYFVHGSGIKSGRTYTGFNDGDTVEFDVREGKKGPVATDVAIIEQ